MNDRTDRVIIYVVIEAFKHYYDEKGALQTAAFEGKHQMMRMPKLVSAIPCM